MSGEYYVATCNAAPGDLDDNGEEIYTPEANAAHIVQCVNQYPALLQQRKELLEALKAIVACFGSSEFRASGCGCAECVAVNGAEAAIAKAEAIHV